MHSLIRHNSHSVLKDFMFRGGCDLQQKLLQNRSQNEVECRPRFELDFSVVFGTIFKSKIGLERPWKRDSGSDLTFIGFYAILLPVILPLKKMIFH